MLSTLLALLLTTPNFDSYIEQRYLQLVIGAEFPISKYEANVNRSPVVGFEFGGRSFSIPAFLTFDDQYKIIALKPRYQAWWAPFPGLHARRLHLGAGVGPLFSYRRVYGNVGGRDRETGGGRTDVFELGVTTTAATRFLFTRFSGVTVYPALIDWSLLRHHEDQPLQGAEFTRTRSSVKITWSVAAAFTALF